MGANFIGIDYTELGNAAAQFERESDRMRQTIQKLRSRADTLRQGWIGRGANAFFAEMNGQVLPAFNRLAEALKQGGVALRKVSQTFSTGEQEAASYLRMGAQAGQGSPEGAPQPGTAPVPGGSGSPIPPPRVYIVNGINSTAAPGQADASTQAMRNMLIGMGYSPDQIVGLPAPYNTNLMGKFQAEGTHFGGLLTPVDALTGLGAKVWNGMMFGANTAVGLNQLGTEYIQGPNGPYTQDAYRTILQDLQRNPLAPGQQIMLVGHSGGGAIMTNLTPMLEARGYDVGQVVTMGSPVANYDQASQYAQVIGFRDKMDVFGVPYLRSDESRSVLPWVPTGINTVGVAPTVGGVLGFDQGARDNNPNISYYGLDSGNLNPVDAHGSYWTSTNLVDILRQQVPSFNSGFATP